MALASGEVDGGDGHGGDAFAASDETHGFVGGGLDADLLHRDAEVAWSGCAVLLRGLTDVEIYLDAMRRAGIPYDVERDRTYYQRREIIGRWKGSLVSAGVIETKA